MGYAFPVAGYLLMVLIIMFGGKKRRPFGQASQAAAGVIITVLSLGAILWFLSAVIGQLVSAGP
jgi:hypothetical protein